MHKYIVNSNNDPHRVKSDNTDIDYVPKIMSPITDSHAVTAHTISLIAFLIGI